MSLALLRVGGTMHFRYQDTKGKVQSLPDVASFLQAIQRGAITVSTPLSVGGERIWHPAGSVAAYREAAAALKRSSGTLPAIDLAPPPEPQRRARLRRGVWVAAAGLAVLALIGLRVHGLTARSDAARRSAIGTLPGNEAQAVLEEIDHAIGDSIAAAQRKLHDWVRLQRFEVRFRGIGLTNGSALRETLVAAERYRIEVDGVVDLGRRISARLLARADTLEGSSGRYDGLGSAADDLLSAWRRDLEEWAVLQRSTAATLDSIAEFLLAKQRSYVVREGSAVFLSRHDGAQFRELLAHPMLLAARERAWADTVLERRPRWMERIPEDSRPAFGRPALP